MSVEEALTERSAVATPRAAGQLLSTRFLLRESATAIAPHRLRLWRTDVRLCWKTWSEFCPGFPTPVECVPWNDTCTCRPPSAAANAVWRVFSPVTDMQVWSCELKLLGWEHGLSLCALQEYLKQSSPGSPGWLPGGWKFSCLLATPKNAVCCSSVSCAWMLFIRVVNVGNS